MRLRDIQKDPEPVLYRPRRRDDAGVLLAYPGLLPAGVLGRRADDPLPPRLPTDQHRLPGQRALGERGDPRRHPPRRYYPPLPYRDGGRAGDREACRPGRFWRGGRTGLGRPGGRGAAGGDRVPRGLRRRRGPDPAGPLQRRRRREPVPRLASPDDWAERAPVRRLVLRHALPALFPAKRRGRGLRRRYPRPAAGRPPRTPVVLEVCRSLARDHQRARSSLGLCRAS